MYPIYDYKCKNNIVKQNDGIIWMTHIKAYDKNNKLIYDEETQFSFSINAYGQETVNVLWNMPDTIMRMVGLRGIYNPIFQHFSFADDTLKIEDKDKKTQIHISSLR